MIEALLRGQGIPRARRVEYTDLNDMIEGLRSAVEDDTSQRGYWANLWSLVGNIKARFREVRYPTNAQKQDAWKRLEGLIRQARDRSERERRDRDKKQKAWEEKVARSDQARGRLSSKVAASTPVNELERMIATVVLAPLILLENILRDVLGLEQLDEVHEDLKKCSAALRQAWQFFNETKGVLLPAAKHSAYEELSKAQNRLNAAWDRWKDAKNRAHEERRRAWQARQADRRRRIEANIDKLEAKLDKAEGALSRSRAHLSTLESDYESAWSDSFKERCQDWINEEETRMRDIEASIDKMRGWLDEERDKLR